MQLLRISFQWHVSKREPHCPPLELKSSSPVAVSSPDTVEVVVINCSRYPGSASPTVPGGVKEEVTGNHSGVQWS